MGDLPTTDVVRDDVTGDLYASTDFGVMMLPGGHARPQRVGADAPVTPRTADKEPLWRPFVVSAPLAQVCAK